MSAALVVARKEAGALLVSARGLTWLLALALVLSGFCLLLVSDTELSLLDNAEVVYDMAGVVVVLGALLALVVGIDTTAGERERGSLIPLLLAPIPRASLLAGKIGGELIAWLVILALALPYLWAVGSTGQNLGDALGCLVVLGTPVVLGFGLLAIGLGARSDSALSSLLIGLVALLLCASPLLLGPSLRQATIGRWFDTVNPVSGVLNALDAVIIDSQPIAAQSASLLTVIAWLILTTIFALTGLRRLTR
jgi:ABC-type transport system involved in multi-copper enzyme maturation permease subunit